MSNLPFSKGLYFKQLCLRNLRCFGEEQLLDLTNKEGMPARWTILLGNNGTGKTTLLQSIAAIELTEPDEIKSGILVGLVPRIGRGITRSPLDTWDLFGRGDFGAPIERAKEDVPLELQAKMGLIEDSALRRDLDIELSVSPEGDQSSTQLVPEEEVDLKKETEVIGYGADRRMAPINSPPKHRELSWATLFPGYSELPNFEDWLLKSEDDPDSRETVKSKEEIEQIKTLLIEVMPDIKAIETVTINKLAEGPRQRARFKTPYGWVRLEDLSLGYKAMVGWIADLAIRQYRRYPDSDNPLAEPAIVLVDEIDLHLHPTWQRKLVQHLSKTFPQTQFVVTAHSPLIVQATSAIQTNLVLLKREGKEAKIKNEVEAIKGWTVDQLLTAELYGIESPYPPQFDEKLKQRRRLLSKSELNEEEEQRLEELREDLASLPLGKSKWELEAMDVIRRYANKLEDTVEEDT